MSELTRYNNYINQILDGESIEYNFTNKKQAINTHVRYMINKTNHMFVYDNLPDTIPRRLLELFLQTNGNICFYEYEENLYIFTGGVGGTPDVYYRPTIYTIANPALNISKSLSIGRNCSIVLNDTTAIGLLPLFYKCATELVETELSLNIANINSRIISLISAADGRTIESAKEYIEKIKNGDLSVISESKFLEDLKTQPFANTGHNAITDIIELNQYYKASWYNEIGLNANYNMKRESLNSAESQLNNDALIPLKDDMLICRQEDLDRVNKMFGTNIKVKINPKWENVLKTDNTDNTDNGGNENEQKTTD